MDLKKLIVFKGKGMCDLRPATSLGFAQIHMHQMHGGKEKEKMILSCIAA